MGKVLAEWPTFGELGELGRTRVGPKATPKPRTPREPVFHDGKRRCNLCFRYLGRKAVPSPSCNGLSPSLACFLNGPRNHHNLHVAWVESS
eukprot:6483324-Pyramimonas_sp.AAC.1